MSESDLGFTERFTERFTAVLKIPIPLKHALLPQRHQTGVTFSQKQDSVSYLGFPRRAA